jgi:NADH-quinone oxidoreductase subunit E
VRHLIPEFEKMKARYPAGFESSLVLPCLRRIQEDRGFVSDDDIAGLCEYLGVPRVQVEEVLSYYTMLLRKPLGKVHLQACRNIACSMRGAEGVIDHLCKRLGVKPGETTPDGRFTVSTVECLGSCGTAPVVMVNEAYHENVTLEHLDRLIEAGAGERAVGKER